MWQSYPKTGAVLWVGDQAIEGSTLRNQALEYAKYLLCEQSVRSAALFSSNTHPDFKLIDSENKNVIKIDSIRELTDWVNGSPRISSMKIALLNPADAMNLQAANALLKTLEEPSAHTLFLLVTKRPHLLPETVRSRCYVVRSHLSDLKSSSIEDVKLHPNSKLEEHKSIADNLHAIQLLIKSDLQALKSQLAEPVSIAAQWLKNDVHLILHWFMIILCDFTNNEKNTQLIKSRRWWRFMDEVIEARKLLEERTQANSQLLVETLLIQYTRIMAN